MLVVGGALATPAMADGGQVGPKQYFREVFGVTSSTAHDVIQVSCAGPETTGHPAAGQYVAAHQIFPPVTTTYGGVVAGGGRRPEQARSELKIIISRPGMHSTLWSDVKPSVG
jgi:hypothetical protein